jgi:ADP-heptose:LPS heptosyltransferase
MTTILLSPFSNSALRDWPHYDALIGLFVDNTDFQMTVIGAASQRVLADRLVRRHHAKRVVNTAGMLPWPEVLQRVKCADLVVANNSGVAHLAATLGAPMVCIFAASHSPDEWMPRATRSTIIVKETACSPCGLDVVENCAFGVRCLYEINAEIVFHACMEQIENGP